MSSELSIEAVGLGKAYKLSSERSASTLREALGHRFRNPLSRRRASTYWALAGVDLEARRGDVIGLIGGNGAGKSTLLKILSRITEPTEGTAFLRGRVGSLLEVGTGFHPELTGRENVFLNGAILGMARSQVARRFDEIVDFAGVARFLDTPVKRYSSGMYVRLAFAVAAHLQPEILLVDEVLAVGDAEFQRRCLGRMESAARDEGRTIVFVSHNLAAVESLCTRAVYLREGRIEVDGSVRDAVDAYMSLGDRTTSTQSVDLRSRTNPHRPDGLPIVERVETLDEALRPVASVPIGGQLNVRLRTRHLAEVRQPVVGVRIRTAADAVLAEATTRMTPLVFQSRRSLVEEITLTLHDVPFVPGEYWVDFGIKDDMDGSVADYGERTIEFTVLPTDYFGSGYQPASLQALVLLRHQWTVDSVDEDG